MAPAVLHPSYKLEYFRDVKWSYDWIATAEDITRAEYARAYEDKPPLGAERLATEKGTPVEVGSTKATDKGKQVCSCAHSVHVVLQYAQTRIYLTVFLALLHARKRQHPQQQATNSLHIYKLT